MNISKEAQAAAVRMGHYCISRFQTDEEAVMQFDVPWFAEKVQLAIDLALTKQAHEINDGLIRTGVLDDV